MPTSHLHRRKHNTGFAQQPAPVVVVGERQEKDGCARVGFCPPVARGSDMYGFRFVKNETNDLVG
jgi:hypothetical protein